MDAISSSRKLYARDALHLKRKIWHISTGSLGLIFFYLFKLDVNTIRDFCLIVTLFALCVELLRLRSDKLNSYVIKLASPFMRKSEVSNFSGLTFYSFGIWLSLTFFQLEIAILSIFFLVFADPISSAIGVLYGREQFLPNKSVEGSLSCFLICYAITFFYLKSFHHDLTFVHIVFSILAGIAGAVSEAVSAFKVDDNLTIPFLSGICLTVFNQYFNVL